MARLSRSNFPFSKHDRARFLGALLVCLLLGGCASDGERNRLFERWPANGAGATTPYLLSLREYLAQPPRQQAAERERLREAAATGEAALQLEYAFALSVDRHDRESLETARAHFESLLAAPDPLPIALDALVRLQLGQVIDRLERMQASADIHRAYRAAATEQKMYRAQLAERTAQLDTLRRELAEVRRKLDALARIEQMVNEHQGPQDDKDDREPKPQRNDQDNSEERENNAEPPDTAR